MSSFLKKTNLLLISLLALAALINIASLNFYFFQDDWFILNDLKNLNFLTIFIPRTDIIYYRPIGMQLFFLVSKNLFGLNPLWFHMVAFAIFLFCVYLVYKLVIVLSNKKTLGLITALLYGTASLHFMALSWLSLTWNYVSLAFFLVALILFVVFENTQKRKYIQGTFLFFALSLLSSEFALIFPFFAAGIIVVREKKLTIKKIAYFAKIFSPFLVVIFLYLVLRILIIPIPVQGVYKPQIGFHIVKDYLWYLLWTFNLPEMFKYHLKILSLTFSSELVNATKDLLPKTIALFFIQLILIMYCCVKSIKLLSKKLVVACITLFLIGLAPVISLPNHTYPYYLTLASLPIIFLIAIAIYNTIKPGNSKVNVVLASLALIFWVLLSYSNQDFNRKTHWIYAEQTVSRKITQNLIDHTIKSPKIVYIYPESDMVKVALLNQQAMNLIFNNSVKTAYIKSFKNVASDQGHLLINWTK